MSFFFFVVYPDVTKMFRMLDPDISNELIVGEGMNHCYPLAPIEEAAPACNKVFHIVLRYLQASRVPVLSIFAFRGSVVGKDLGAAAE